MIKNLAYVLTLKEGNPQSLCAVIDGKTVSRNNTDTNFKEIWAELAKEKHDFAKIRGLLDIAHSVKEYMGVKADTKNGRVYFKGKEIHNSLTRRIIEFMRTGVPCDRLIKFLVKLQLNPNENSRNQLYDYCENYRLPITSDGEFLAYKAVASDFKDKYTGTIDNSPGQIVSMHRSRCNESADVACASSLHCGNFEYCQSYGDNPTDKFVLVSVSPTMVVSCPKDSSWQKLRVCKYKVLQEVAREKVVEFKDENADNYYNVRDAKGRLSRVLRDKRGRFAVTITPKH